jgi:hypothetical protein
MNHGMIGRSMFAGRGGFLGAALALLVGGCGPEGDEAADEAAPVASELRIGVVPAFFFVSDLKPDGTMRFYNGGSDIGVQINVTNVGNAAATGPSGQVNIGGRVANAALYQYFGGTSTTANTVNPGERGYLMVHLPVGSLAPCNKYLVHIDTTRSMQGGLPDPFVNDEATVATQCLQWTTPISSDNFPFSDPLINGRSIQQIVSSQVVGRRDGLLCSQCHYTGSGLPYSPPVARGGTAVITPNQVIAGRTWAGPGGWARAFLGMPTDKPGVVSSKPFYLQAMFQTWIDDGEKYTPPLFGDLRAVNVINAVAF